MTKRFFILLMISFMLAACGSSDENEVDNTNFTDETEQAPDRESNTHADNREVFDSDNMEQNDNYVDNMTIVDSDEKEHNDEDSDEGKEIPDNIAPLVNAGSDQEILLSESASLNGTVTDDGLPENPGKVSTIWSKISGPGTVTFDDTTKISTDAEFSKTGEYIVRLTADDSELSAFDEVKIIVKNSEPSLHDLSKLEWLDDAGNWKFDDCKNGGACTFGVLKKPGGDGPFPAVVLNHGKNGQSENTIKKRGAYFLKRGYVIIAADMTHSSTKNGPHSHPIPDWLFSNSVNEWGANEQNVKRADLCVEILKSLPYVDDSKIVMWGFSMGGLLTTRYVGDHPNRVKAAAVLAGGIGSKAHYAKAEQVESITIPIAMFHSDPDGTVNAVSSENLKSILDSNGVDNVRYLINNHGHVITNISELEPIIENWYNEIVVMPATNPDTPFKFTSLSQNQSLKAPVLIEVSTDDDINNSISKVEFYSGTTKIGEDTSYPFSFNWVNPGLGEKKITALFTDPDFGDNGMVAYTRELTINIIP